jgi:hypothetical protein
MVGSYLFNGTGESPGKPHEMGKRMKGVKKNLPAFLLILVRSPCKNLKPYDNPFWYFE